MPESRLFRRIEPKAAMPCGHHYPIDSIPSASRRIPARKAPASRTVPTSKLPASSIPCKQYEFIKQRTAHSEDALQIQNGPGLGDRGRKVGWNSNFKCASRVDGCAKKHPLRAKRRVHARRAMAAERLLGQKAANRLFLPWPAWLPSLPVRTPASPSAGASTRLDVSGTLAPSRST